MKRYFFIALALLLCQPVLAGKKTEFRAYTANKLKQQDKMWLGTGAAKPGCHNMLIKLEIYRVAQIGFDHCVIYADKDCKEGTEIPVSWKNKDKSTTTITQGARWFLPGETGSDMGSWKCLAAKKFSDGESQ